LERNFYSRCPPEKRPRFIKEQEVFTPTDEVTQEKLEPDGGETPPEVVEKGAEAGTKKVYDESLVFALEKTFRYHFWLGGILQLIGGMAFAGAYVPNELN
jgi:ATP-binding cassette, subfamily C (CFTR/MRP), member 1